MLDRFNKNNIHVHIYIIPAKTEYPLMKIYAWFYYLQSLFVKETKMLHQTAYNCVSLSDLFLFFLFSQLLKILLALTNYQQLI